MIQIIWVKFLPLAMDSWNLKKLVFTFKQLKSHTKLHLMRFIRDKQGTVYQKMDLQLMRRTPFDPLGFPPVSWLRPKTEERVPTFEKSADIGRYCFIRIEARLILLIFSFPILNEQFLGRFRMSLLNETTFWTVLISRSLLYNDVLYKTP